MNKQPQIVDPPRYPRLINPIEQAMKLKFEAVVNLIKIDVTRRLTQMVKK